MKSLKSAVRLISIFFLPRRCEGRKAHQAEFLCEPFVSLGLFGCWRKSFRALVLAYILISLFISDVHAQEKVRYERKAGIAIGSLRNRYPYPVTDLLFNTGIIRSRLQIYSRLRAYGIRSIFGGHNYDVTVYGIAHWSITSETDFYAGGGAELMLRLNNDDRSQATSGVQPLLVMGMNCNKSKFGFNLPIWTRLYANGISVSALPETSYSIGQHFELFLRFELSYLAVYGGASHEWRYDSMVGAYYKF